MDDATAEKIEKVLGPRPEFRPFNRDLHTYVVRLFPDSEMLKELEQRKTVGSEFESGNQMQTSGFFGEEPIRQGHNYYPAGQPIEKVTHSSETLSDIFGGLEEFFNKGSALLDIGSGGGQAIDEIRVMYPGLRIQGLDIRYGIDRPQVEVKSPYIAASWEHLPYQDNSFDRFLSYESFPRYPLSGKDDPTQTGRVFKEISRIAKDGSLWRGTLPSMVSGDRLMEGFTLNGWEVYVAQRKLFVARSKKDSL